MNLAAYRNYKTTEAPWLGDVPSHWEVRRLRTVLRLRNEKNSPVKTEQILSLSIAHGVTLYSHEGRGGNKRKGDITAYKIAHAGDIVLNSMNVIVGAVGLSRYTGAISPVYYALFPATDEVDIKYYDKVFGNPAFQRYLLIYGKGILIKKSNTGKLNTIRMKISPDDLKGTLLPIPPKDEQQQIARLLDWKTAQINKFIRNKRRLIELLKEQKQNVINQAVTRGLDPKVNFKPSGVEWIGDIPEHWEVRRIRACIESYVAGIWGEEPEARNSDEHIVCIRVADFDMRNLSISQANLTIRAIPQNAQKTRLLKAGDILMEKSGGGDAEPVGRVVYFDVNFAAVTSNFVTRLRPDLCVIKPRFLLFVLANLQAIRRNMPSIKQTTGIQNLDERHYLSNYLGLPTLAEQESIVEYIDKKCAEIDQAIIRAQREIELMREYRTRLISDVVTGQVDVRNVKCEGGSLNEDEFEDIEEVEEEIELPEGGEDDE